MPLNNPVSHEGYVPAYQISATPFLTSSLLSLGEIKEINFGFVSRFLIIKNTGPSASVMAVGFTENGLKSAQSNYFILSGSETFSAELRTDRVFLSGSVGSTSFSMVAGLTQVPQRNFVMLTGSNGFPGVG